MNADAIVKALKCCNVPSSRACGECPYHEVGSECRTQRNKDAAELIEEMAKAYHDLEYILMGVMHFVDKWLDDDELKLDEFNRALRMREKTLQIVEGLIKENEELKSDLKDAEEEYERVYEQAEADIRGNIADGGTSCHWCADKTKTDTVKKMQERLKNYLKEECDGFIGTSWIDLIAKEVLEEN